MFDLSVQKYSLSFVGILFVSVLLLLLYGTAVSLFFNIMILMLIFMSFHKKEFNNYINIFLFGVMYAVCLYYNYQFIFGMDLPYYLGGSDDLAYEESARNFVEVYNWNEYSKIRGNIVSEFHNSVGYVYFLSLLTRFGDMLGGYHTMMPRIFNIFIVSSFCILIFNTSVRFLSLKRMEARLVILFFGLNPLILYVSSHVYRDILASFIMFFYLYALLSWRLIYFLILAPFLLLITYEMRQVVAIFMALIVPVLYVMKVKNKLFRTFSILVLISFLLFLLFTLGAIDRLNTYSETYSEYRSERAKGLSGIVFTLPLYYGFPLRVLFYFITPVPVFKFEFDKLMLICSSLLQIISFPIFILGAKSIFRDKNKYIKIYFSIFLCLLSGMAVTSFSVRHMVIFYPYGVLTACYIFFSYLGLKHNIRVVTYYIFCTFLFLTFLYVIYKSV